MLSPLLFNYYSEAIFKEALANNTWGIKINGRVVNSIRYADNTLVFTDNTNDLQTTLKENYRVSNKYGLKINFKKTKYMVITKTHLNCPNVNINIDSNPIERVSKYKYLEIWINDKHY